MRNEQLNREVTVQFSENEFETISFMSARLGVSIPIREDLDRERISEILNELFHEKDKAITLAKEIKAQLIDDEHQRETLNITTEKRLLRWAHPARVDDRTRFVKPRAREICMILFGFIPERKD